MRKILLAAFILIALVQWFVPGNMICNKERVVQKGKNFRFETEPVDPADPFRGRYIFLNFKLDTFAIPKHGEVGLEQEVYVLLDNDAQGFAQIKNAMFTKPANEHDYVRVKAYVMDNGNSYLMNITWPFEKFYMEESKAPKAEEDYWQSMRDSTNKTYALIKVYNGDAVIENVFINDKPLVH